MDSNEVRVQTLKPEEIEAMLVNDFGDKLQPVDGAKLMRQRQQHAAMAANKLRFQKNRDARTV